MLSQLLEAASKAELDGMRNLWIQILVDWVSAACSEASARLISDLDGASPSTDSGPKPKYVAHFEAFSLTELNIEDIYRFGPAHEEASVLLQVLMQMLDKARAVSRVELYGSKSLHMAGDFAFMCAFSSLPQSLIDPIARAAATWLCTSIDARGSPSRISIKRTVTDRENLLDLIQVNFSPCQSMSKPPHIYY